MEPMPETIRNLTTPEIADCPRLIEEDFTRGTGILSPARYGRQQRQVHILDGGCVYRRSWSSRPRLPGTTPEVQSSRSVTSTLAGRGKDVFRVGNPPLSWSPSDGVLFREGFFET